MTTQTLSQSISGRLYSISLPKINFQKTWIIGFILLASLLIFYIFQISQIAKVSSLVSQYEKKITVLSQQNKNLETTLSKTNSLANLETTLEDLNYEKVGEIHYIKVLDSTVLAK